MPPPCAPRASFIPQLNRNTGSKATCLHARQGRCWAQVCELSAVRLNAAGVLLEVALTAGLAHPNLVAARAHAIVRFAPRSRDRTAALQRDTASLDGRARGVPAGPAAGFMAGPAAGSAGPAAAAEPTGQPAAVGGRRQWRGRTQGQGSSRQRGALRCRRCRALCEAALTQGSRGP